MLLLRKHRKSGTNEPARGFLLYLRKMEKVKMQEGEKNGMRRVGYIADSLDCSEERSWRMMTIFEVLKPCSWKKLTDSCLGLSVMRVIRRKPFSRAYWRAYFTRTEPNPIARYCGWITRSSRSITKPPSAVLIVNRRLIIPMISS